MKQHEVSGTQQCGCGLATNSQMKSLTNSLVSSRFSSEIEYM